jgi:hypothetical protein
VLGIGLIALGIGLIALGVGLIVLGVGLIALGIGLIVLVARLIVLGGVILAPKLNQPSFFSGTTIAQPKKSFLER